MYIKTLVSKVYPLLAKPKEMVIAQPTNNHTAGIGPKHSTKSTLLLELNVICEQNWVQLELQNSLRRVFALDGKIYTTIWQTYEIGSQLKFLIFSE